MYVCVFFIKMVGRQKQILKNLNLTEAELSKKIKSNLKKYCDDYRRRLIEGNYKIDAVYRVEKLKTTGKSPKITMDTSEESNARKSIPNTTSFDEMQFDDDFELSDLEVPFINVSLSFVLILSYIYKHFS